MVETAGMPGRKVANILTFWYPDEVKMLSLLAAQLVLLFAAAAGAVASPSPAIADEQSPAVHTQARPGSHPDRLTCVHPEHCTNARAQSSLGTLHAPKPPSATVYVSSLGNYEGDDGTPYIEIGGEGLSQLGPIYFLPAAGTRVKGIVLRASDIKMDVAFPGSECGIAGVYMIDAHAYSGISCDFNDVIIVNHAHGDNFQAQAGLEVAGYGLALMGPIYFRATAGGTTKAIVLSQTDSSIRAYFPGVPCGIPGQYEIGVETTISGLTCAAGN